MIWLIDDDDFGSVPDLPFKKKTKLTKEYVIITTFSIVITLISKFYISFFAEAVTFQI